VRIPSAQAGIGEGGKSGITWFVSLARDREGGNAMQGAKKSFLLGRRKEKSMGEGGGKDPRSPFKAVRGRKRSQY